MYEIVRKSLVLLISISLISSGLCANEVKPLRISLTVSAKSNQLEVSWFHAKPREGYILITNEEPREPFRRYEKIDIDVIDEPIDETLEPTSTTFPSLITESSEEVFRTPPPGTQKTIWTFGPDNKTAVHWLQPEEETAWMTTHIPFDNNLTRNITIQTRCYGFWAVYISNEGTILANTCISAQPTWMNDMRDHIKGFRFCNLFIVGSHDSGSFRTNFNPHGHDSIVTKYSLTQTDDITGQLMHGIRYLDIRVGYYRSLEPRFWVNHGISRQQPLDKILRQVRDFVLETNEIVIFDVQEFPVGFGKKSDIHRQLVQFIQREIGELMADPALGWDATLESIWQMKRNIIVSYDNIAIVQEFPSLLWRSVQQRWGNVQSLPDLRRHLVPVVLFSSRPVADMAEMTPTGWDLITDRLGGLRKMADQTNRHVSKWYLDDWGPMANVVAVDFYRGTNLIDVSLYWNSKKEHLEMIH